MIEWLSRSRRGALRVGIVLVICTAQLGCAAAFRGSQAPVTVRSVPEGATVEASGRTLGVTPAKTEVSRHGQYILQVHKPGYEQASVQLERSPNVGWVVADVLTCVIPVLLCIPLLVDAVSGAWMDIEPEYIVTLRPKAETPASQPAAVAPPAVAPPAADPPPAVTPPPAVAPTTPPAGPEEPAPAEVP